MSTKLTLDTIDWQKVAIGALIAAAGSAITFLTPVITGIDWTVGGVDYTPFMVVVWSTIVNLSRKFLITT